MATSKEAFKIALGSLVLHHPGVNAPLYEASINQYVEELEDVASDLAKEVQSLTVEVRHLEKKLANGEK